MPVYELRSELFEGHIVFEYENDRLKKYVDYSDMGDLQRTYFSANFPMYIKDLERLNTATATIKRVEKQTDFESFSESNKKTRK